LLSVPIDDNENGIMGLYVALPAAYLENRNEVHRDINPWAARLRQQLHASVRPVPHRTYVPAGRTGLGIGLDLARHAWPVILSGHWL
jgi:hypothetical protein